MTNTGVLHGADCTDVRMMVVAHSSFRRELKLAIGNVRSTPGGDRRRTELVAEHVALFLDLVHHHHSIEDELLWDVLAERVPDEVAPLIDLMQAQHAAVHQLLTSVTALVVVWRSSASSEDRALLADQLSVLVDALCEHLDTEEERVLPLMAQHINAAEWEEFTKQGMAAIPKGMMLVGFGMMLYEGDPAVLALEIKKLPAPVRPLLPVLGRRAFRRYATRLHGTPTPARGRS
jgi:hemerythrin-like domain-containing protein